MTTQTEAFYKAVLARDYRFDGKFYVGVKTTGIYCRPICPAKPKRENVEFFASALLAEKAGYRACLRCRPDCAPGSPAWGGKNTTIDLALKLLSQNAHEGLSEETFAGRLGMGARHLRRLFKEELGKTPKEIYDDNRLNFARTLVRDTFLSMTDIAFAAGFGSLRRFNDAMRQRFRCAPSHLRRKTPSAIQTGGGIQLSLAYRPPLDWAHLLAYYERHRLMGVERIEKGVYERVFKLGKTIGAVRVFPHATKPELVLNIALPEPKYLFKTVQMVRRMFDLDSDPLLVANAFSGSKKFSALVKKYPGLRLPRGWDAFEALICTVLGQLVSVEHARRLIQQLILGYGESITHPLTGQPAFLFPRPEALANASLKKVKTTDARKKTIREAARRVLAGELSLASTQEPAAFRTALRSIKGIGPWSAESISLRALGDTDAFPHTDLILQRALTLYSTEEVKALRPWRGYAAIYLWKEFAAMFAKQKTEVV